VTRRTSPLLEQPARSSRNPTPVQPPTRPNQPLVKPTRAKALEDRARSLLSTSAARRLRTPRGVNRRRAEAIAVQLYSGNYTWEYLDQIHDIKRLTKFVRALRTFLLEHDG
jgi:hypothetical protein